MWVTSQAVAVFNLRIFCRNMIKPALRMDTSTSAESIGTVFRTGVHIFDAGYQRIAEMVFQFVSPAMNRVRYQPAYIRAIISLKKKEHFIAGCVPPASGRVSQSYYVAPFILRLAHTIIPPPL